MSQIFKKILERIEYLKSCLLRDEQQKSLFEYFKAKPRRSVSSNNVVLVQCVEDLFYFGLFGEIVTSLREQKPLRVEQFMLRSLSAGESSSLSLLIKRRLIDYQHYYKWVRSYCSFCDSVGYSSTSFSPINDLIDFFNARLCWKNLTDKRALVDLIIHNVKVGDLINDSYLRFKPAPTVNLKDFYLCVVIWQAFRDVRRAKKYFSKTKPVLYLTSYSTYVQHGIAVRVALSYGVHVFSFGNFQEFAKKLTIEDDVHTKNPDNYASAFLRLNNQDEKLDEADAALALRISGGIDSATAYMKTSAYSSAKIDIPNLKDAVVIFLHDFYDSPHVYRDMVFPDFWEWICFTIETLTNAEITFFIKPHPNQINLNDAVLNDLIHCYPTIKFVLSEASNKQIAEAGIVCAVTVYGTVAHEMAYLGVPTITCAHHPHVSFDFCTTAKSKEEYSAMLWNCTKILFKKTEMRRQSLIFYHMHNLHLDKEEKALRDMVLKFRSTFAEIDKTNSDLVNYLKEINKLKGYADFIALLISTLNQNGRKGTKNCVV
jgi:hypothetical protein